MSSGLEPVPINSQKHDPAWKHCQMFKNGERVHLKCLYCGKVFKGGGIHRIKEHLAGHKGNASTCLRVPSDVRALMQQSLDGVVVKKRKKQKIAEEICNINPSSSGLDTFSNQCDVSEGLQLVGISDALEPSSSMLVAQEEGTSSRGVDKRKRGRGKSASEAVDIVPVNSVSVGSKRISNQVHMAVGRFLYDIGAPLDAVRSVYFQPMVDAIASEGLGVAAPSYHDLRGWILRNAVGEMRSDFDKYVATWERTGCSIMVEQCTSATGRVSLNFLVYSPGGTVFLKSVDASEIVNSSDALYELLKLVVEEVGVKHVLQVITNGEEQYAVAGRRLTDTFPTLYWAPCAIHSTDLILEDFGKLEWINEIIEQAKSITRFVYNHTAVLNMMRRYTFGNDIIELGVTRSATNFTTLKRMIKLKHNLQGMVTSQEWMDCPYSKSPGGLAVLDFISNQSFWSSCALIVQLTEPLLRVLRIASSEKRPAMGYIYAAMYRAKETIKKELLKRHDYMVYWNIIDHRWEQQWQLPLHCAGFYLNPKFFYSIEGDMHSEIVSGMFDGIERLVPDIKVQDKIIKEIHLYKNAVGDLGRKMAIRARDTLLPGEWWSTYGGGCPNLARLAIRILGQTCCSIGCNQNKVHVEQMHSTKNCLEHQRLSDLVFVQYNLQLKRKIHKNSEQDTADPISCESISLVEDWVTEKEVNLEKYGSSDWMALDLPAVNTMILGPSVDEAESLGGGFDDYEIFGRVRDGEENVEDNAESQYNSLERKAL